MTTDVFINSFGARWQDPPPPRTAEDGLALPRTHPTREQEPTR
ncbi:hypothetical protein ABT354_30880 [Streptomyces sp. NPDC000594]